MTLTLSIVRGPAGVPTESRQIADGVLNIGRGPANDWVLPDPDRVLSKRHCVIARLEGAWQVSDTSANGTFLNHDPERLGPDGPRILRDGDILLLGSYVIEAGIDTAANTAGPDEERLTRDPFAAPHDDPLGIAMPSADGPAMFGNTTPDRVPAFAGNFQAPRAHAQVLPEDWDLDETPARTPPPASEVTSQAALPDRPPASPGPPPAAEPAQTSQTAAAAFAAFAAGAGISGTNPGEPLALLHGLGSAFRAAVSGLRRTMIARAAIKGEFRIDQTMIQAAGNNPLKFSADDDDALAALLGIGRRSDMSAEQAVSEAMRDIRLHELAMATAMQQAVRDLLGRLAPSQVTRSMEPRSLDRLPARRKARQWDAYESLHRATEQALGDDFDSVFGKSFMRAYERAMQEIAASDKDEDGHGRSRQGE